MKTALCLVLVLVVGVGGIAVESACAAFRDEVLARNPVGYWEFEGDLTDSSGNGNTLTAFGDAGISSAYSGRIGAAGTFYKGGPYSTGAGFYVDTPAGNALNFGGTSFSINLWCSNVNSTEMATGTRIMVNKRYGATWNGYWNSYGMWMTIVAGPPKALELRAVMWNGGLDYSPSSGNLPLPADEAHVWHMATVAWDGTTKYFYWDGQPLGGGASWIPQLTNTAYRLIIGNDDSPGTTDGGNNGWEGMLDEVAIFSTCLSAADVAAMYAAAPPVTIGTFEQEVLERNPVGYWRFQGNPNDSSGNGNTLSLNSSAGYASAAAAPGVYGQAGSLGASATDSFYVNTPGGSSLNIEGSNWAANLWFSVNDDAQDLSPQRTQILFAKKLSTSGAWPWPEYALFLQSAGSPLAYNFLTVMDSAGTAVFDTPETKAIGSNEWHMVTCSFMPDSDPGTFVTGNMTLYLDGKWLGGKDVFAVLPFSTQHRFIIGNDGAVGDVSYGNGVLGGLIDEVAIFGTSLTGADVYELWSASQIPPPVGTVVLVR